MSGELVLVTGGSGFLGVHCVLRLIEAGYTVRTTVRSLAREQEVRAMLRVGGVDPGDKLSFVVADLTADKGWPEAVDGCAYVQHVASPFPAARPRDENELIIPAREGTLRVLRAARDAGVRRVVLTSSIAAMNYGHTNLNRTFTEQDWTNLDGPDVFPYAKSKTLAERAAWDFVTREGGSLELSVVNPAGIFGPALGPDLSTSMVIIQRLLNRDMPALPRLSATVVDVRDVADLHLRAMTDPAAPGERFVAAVGDPMWISEIAGVLRDRLGVRVPTRELPDLLVRLAARADQQIRLVLPELRKVKKMSAEKARRVLGWQPRSAEETIIDGAESLIRLGLLKKNAA